MSPKKTWSLTLLYLIGSGEAIQKVEPNKKVAISWPMLIFVPTFIPLAITILATAGPPTIDKYQVLPCLSTISTLTLSFLKAGRLGSLYAQGRRSTYSPSMCSIIEIVASIGVWILW